MQLTTWSNKLVDQPRFYAETITADKLIPAPAKIDLNAFPAVDAFDLEVDAASDTVAAAATGILTFTQATEYDIPKGYLLPFSGGGYARLTKRLPQGETTAEVESIGTDIAPAETATFNGVRPRVEVLAGTLLGRTFAERDAGDPFGPGDVANDDELYLLAFELLSEDGDDLVTLLRHNTLIYENKLPQWATMTADEKAWIRNNYHTIISADA